MQRHKIYQWLEDQVQQRLTTKGVTELLPPLWWWLYNYGLTELYTKRIYFIVCKLYLSLLKLKIKSFQVVQNKYVCINSNLSIQGLKKQICSRALVQHVQRIGLNLQHLEKNTTYQKSLKSLHKHTNKLYCSSTHTVPLITNTFSIMYKTNQR